MRKSKISKYNGFGMIEVLFALIVLGLASAAFLSMASIALKMEIQNDRYDVLTQEAKVGAEMVRGAVSKDTETNASFPWITTGTDSGLGKCYYITGTYESPTIRKDAGTFVSPCTYDNYEAGNCPSIYTYTGYYSSSTGTTSREKLVADQVFRIMCIPSSVNDINSTVLLIKVITGYKQCEGSTRACDFVPAVEYVSSVPVPVYRQ